MIEDAIRLLVNTLTDLLVAVNGLMTDNDVLVATVTGACIEPIVTLLPETAGLNPLPLIIMVEPAEPLSGVIEAITGAGIKIKPGSADTPPGPVTVTLPVAPEPTIAIILVGDTTVKEFAGNPPKLTLVAFVKFCPVIVMAVAV